jgi:uncharacterized protein YfaP (DUF2135 family)
MRKIFAGRPAARVAAWLSAAALLSCGGGGAEGDRSLASKPFGTHGVPAFLANHVVGLIGIVVDATNGNAIPNVTVTAGSITTTTDANGNFAMPTIPNGTSVVSFTIASYAPQSRTVVISPIIETSVIMLMTPNATTASSPFNPTAPTTLNTGTSSQVTVPADALTLADGTTLPTGNVTAIVTPLSTSQDAYLEPGEYVVTPSGGGSAPFQTFGALDIRMTDSAGNAVTTVTDPVGNPVTIRIPVSTRASSPPPSASLFRFDPASGNYVEDGTATLVGGYYQGNITRIGTWVAGLAYTQSTISVCVENQDGVRIAGARVQSDGTTYSGGGAAITDASGVALVPMMQGTAQAVITATSPRSSNSATVVNPGATSTLTPCLIMPTSGLTIRLTWGSLPSDLDSHLKGPNSTHVYYVTRGSLSSQPFAALDVDDTTGFGPEVITVARQPVGTSEYFVHNFSNTFAPGMTGSPARVEMRFGSQIRIFFPPAGEGANDYWRVFQFVVAGDCSVTFSTVGVWSATEPVDPSNGATGTYCQ